MKIVRDLLNKISSSLKKKDNFLFRKEVNIILNIMDNHGEMYGNDIFEIANGNFSRGAMNRGTMYVTLSYLEEKGYVSVREETYYYSPSFPRRKLLYRITPKGREYIRS